jgi:lysophospholipase L1-like esterase
MGLAAIALTSILSVSSFAQKKPATTKAVLDPNKPTLWLVGDSTVHNGTPGLIGWGEVISPFFDTSKLNIENRALGGRSSRTFQTEGKWDAILAECKAGDFVLIQLGHNDSSPINEKEKNASTRARGTIKGVGEETEEVDNILTGKHEVVHSYGWYMRKYVNDAKSKGMIPIICSPIPRLPKETVKESDYNKPAAERGSYVAWAAEVAKSTDIQFIDLNQIVLSHYNGTSAEDLKAKYFPKDGTHTNQEGAVLNASCVVEGLRALKDAPLAQYLLPAK